MLLRTLSLSHAVPGRRESELQLLMAQVLECILPGKPGTRSPSREPVQPNPVGEGREQGTSFSGWTCAFVRRVAVNDRVESAVLSDLPYHNAPEPPLQRVARLLSDKRPPIEADVAYPVHMRTEGVILLD